MLIPKNYKRLLLVVRQFSFLLNKGENTETALSQLRSTLGTTQTSELDIIEKLMSSSSDEVQLPNTFGPLLLLKQLVNPIKQHGGDSIKFFEVFQKTFLSEDSMQHTKNYDTSGIMLYLITLIIMALIVATIYTGSVFPAIEKMITETGSSLPNFSLMIFSLFSNWGGVLVIIITTIIIFLFTSILKIRNNLNHLEFFGNWILNLPGFNTIAKHYNLYLSLRFMQLIMHSGVSHEDAKKIIFDLSSTANVKLDIQLQQLNSKQQENLVDQPLTLADSLGNLDDEINFQIETLYETSLINFTRLKESISFIGIIFIASIIGSLVIAMYLPLFKMGQVAGGL